MNYNPEAVAKISRDIAKRFKINEQVADIFVYDMANMHSSNPDRTFLEDIFIKDYIYTCEKLDIQDFVIVGDSYVDLYDLNVGDYFAEDTFPEVYRVMSKRGRIVKAYNLTNKKDSLWEYSSSAYAPSLVQLEFPETE